MKSIEDIAELEALYGMPSQASITKVSSTITPLLAKWISASGFCILSTVGPEGVDGSPRGDEGPVVQILDQSTLALPDWRGNNRMDSLRNIVRDPRCSLMFFASKSANVIRVNGKAIVTTDDALKASFEHKGKEPRSVVVLSVEEAYPQCARALLRSNLWKREDVKADLPTVGQMLNEQEASFDDQQYDQDWPIRAAKTMW